MGLGLGLEAPKLTTREEDAPLVRVNSDLRPIPEPHLTPTTTFSLPLTTLSPTLTYLVAEVE